MPNFQFFFFVDTFLLTLSNYPANRKRMALGGKMENKPNEQNVEIAETEWDFSQEEERIPYLKKSDVTNDMDATLLSAVQKEFVSKIGKRYKAFSLIVQLDETTKKEISPIFRSEMMWKKVKPIRVRITVIKEGEFLQWRILSL